MINSNRSSIENVKTTEIDSWTREEEKITDSG